MKTIVIPQTTHLKFIRLYLEFLRPLTNLTDRENEALSHILYRRFLYIKNEGMRDGKALYRLLFSSETRKEIREQLNMTYAAYGNILASMKLKGVLIEKGGFLLITSKLLINPEEDKGLKITFKGVFKDEAEED